MQTDMKQNAMDFIGKCNGFHRKMHFYMSSLRFQEAAQETETVFIFYYFQYRFSN